MAEIEQPSGTVTFLFSDIEGSTPLWDQHHGDMQTATARHDAILQGVIDARGGYVFTTAGDEFAASFSRADEAIEAAVEIQAALAAEPFPATTPIRVRMGLHTGDPVERDRDYFGPAVIRAARLMGMAHGGQILLSGPTADIALTSLPGGSTIKPRGEVQLKGLGRAERVSELRHPGSDHEYPEFAPRGRTRGRLAERQKKVEKFDEYRTLYAEKLHDHRIDPGERHTLDTKRDKLRLTESEAAAIEAEYRATQQEVLDAIAGYEKTLRTYLGQGTYPFTDSQRAELQARQKDLALTPEHIAGLEEAAVVEWKDATARAEREHQAEQSRQADAARAEQEQREEAERQAAAEKIRAADAERVAQEQREEAERQAAEEAVRAAKEQAEAWAREVAAVLDGAGEFASVQPNISDAYLAAAITACDVPDHEIVIGLVGPGSDPDLSLAVGLHAV